MAMRETRCFDFELVPFAGGTVERVRVATINRAFAFSMAAARAVDPNDLWKVRLVRDGGRDLDPSSMDEWNVPAGHESTRSARLVSERLGDWSGRGYSCSIALFGGGEAGETFLSSGRVNVFTEAAFASSTPDGVMEVELWTVSDVEDEYLSWQIDPTLKYGGVTADLNDPLIPLIVPAS